MDEFMFFLKSATLTTVLYSIVIPLLKAGAIGIISLIAAKYAQKIISKLIEQLKIATELEKIICVSVKYSIYLLGATFALRLLTQNFTFVDTTALVTAGLVVVKAIGVLLVGLIVISYAEKLLAKALEASTLDPVLFSFIRSFFKIAAFVVLVIMTLEMLGLPTATLVAGLSAVGLAVSLAVSDNIANLTSGLIVIVTKPFTKGDFIELDGISGKVDEIGLVYTTLSTFDNKKIYVPNNDTSKAKITNHSAEPMRRLDLTFSIGYNDDFARAKAIIREVAENSGLIVVDENHQIYVGMCEHAASSINIVARVWVDWTDFYSLQLYMLENVKIAFDKEGINIPYNQLDVHIINK